MSEITKIILACDESGAKGYADRDEAFDGEIGVFAGILVPESIVPQVLPDFQAIYDRYVPPSGKFHIADLPPEHQQSLRLEIFEAIRKHKLPCFWYAVHVAGIYDFHKSQTAVFEGLRQQKREEGQEPRVKRGSPRKNPPSLHVALFTGLYAHVVAFLAEKDRKLVEIEIRSDQIDSPILGEFEAAAVELLGNDPLINNVTGFDVIEKKLVHGQISIQARIPPELDIDVVVQGLVINPVKDGDPLVLASDILANSLNYHFKNRDDADRYAPLNTSTAVETHPLAQNLDAFLQWEHDPVGDGIWAHPKSRQQ